MIKPYSGNRHFRKDLGFVGSDARSRGLEWHLKNENKPLKRYARLAARVHRPPADGGK